MKYGVSLALFVAVAIAGSLAWADHHEAGEKDQDHGWFDAEHCAVCKPLAEHPEMMSKMDFESHKIKNGMMMVMMVPEDQLDTFRECCAKMNKNIEKSTTATSAEKPQHLCGFCESMGDLMQAGAKMEKVETNFGTITLVTSDKPEVVAKIQRHAEKSQAEMEKMMASTK